MDEDVGVVNIGIVEDSVVTCVDTGWIVVIGIIVDTLKVVGLSVLLALALKGSVVCVVAVGVVTGAGTGAVVGLSVLLALALGGSVVAAVGVVTIP